MIIIMGRYQRCKFTIFTLSRLNVLVSNDEIQLQYLEFLYCKLKASTVRRFYDRATFVKVLEYKTEHDESL
jgi:hypothetical protein